ncbi:MAG: TatD family hydrolase [Armatimonadetes bacterium]|nr:TatD family hydrolase [Armatimonadota bacterium]
MGESSQHLIDTHAHLNHPRLLRKLPQILGRAQTARVTQMVVVGYDLPSCEQALELAVAHPEIISAAVGIHPHDASDVRPEALDQLRVLAQDDHVVAIGETGLDFYRDLSPRDVQRQSLHHHLDLARELSLPVIIHCRDAQEELLSILESRRPTPLVWHCFDGDQEHARRALELGALLGFGGRLTYRTAADLRTVVSQVPLDHLLLETDCPYLAPEPHRGKDNEPSYLPLIAQAVADTHGCATEEVAAASTRAARAVFQLP